MRTHSEKYRMPLIRLGHLMAFSRFLYKEGVPFEGHVRRAGLPLLCEDSNCFVPNARVWACFDRMAQVVDPLLGWRVGRYVGDRNLNHTLLARLETAPTLYQALHLLFVLLKAEATDLKMGLHDLHEEADDVLVFVCYSGLREASGYHEAQAYQIGVILDLIRHFVGRSWIPEEIGIERRDLPPGLADYFPETLILTQRAYGYIRVPRRLLYRKKCNATNEHPVKDPLNIADKPDFVGMLRALMTTYLSEGYPSSQLAASLMDISERTLARRLAEHGLTYGKLVDEVRFDLAKERLRAPGAKIGEVARSVGFSDQGNFNRMFRRLTGVSPKDYRSQYMG